MTRFLADTK